MKFQTDVAGNVAGIRFYKGAGNTGTHVGNLWNSTGASAGAGNLCERDGKRLADGALWYTGGDCSRHDLCGVVPHDVGFYSVDAGYFSATDSANPPLRALATGEEGPNGVYAYGAEPRSRAIPAMAPITGWTCCFSVRDGGHGSAGGALTAPVEGATVSGGQ